MRGLAIAFCFAVWATAASGADIKILSQVSLADDVSKFEDTCTYSLSGEIVEGDGARLIAALQSGPQDNDFGSFGILCLDSPGGSYAEAIKMIDALKEKPAGTYIREGAQCLSACSLVFMAGRVNQHETGPMRHRHLHINGKLGFHSPALNFPEGIYDKAVVDAAYRSALKSLSLAVDKLLLQNDADGTPWMKPSLVSLMLATPAESMAYVSTIDDIGRWEVNIVPDISVDKSRLDLREGCNNLLAWRKDEPAQGAQRVNESANIEKIPRQNYVPEQYRVIEQGMYNEGCTFTLDFVPGANFIRAVPFFEIDNQAPAGMSPYQFLKPETKLSAVPEALAALSSGVPVASGSRCRITNPETQVLSESPCTLNRMPPIRDDMVATDQYVWPDQTKTVVSEMKDGSWLINGSAALRHTDQTRSGTPTCYLNSKTRNSFCYFP